MNTITVYLLIAVSSSAYFDNRDGHGVLTVVGQFPTNEKCMAVRNNIPHVDNTVKARCIQSTIVVPKGY